MYPKFHKNSNGSSTFAGVRQIGPKDSTKNVCNFDKAPYFWFLLETGKNVWKYKS